MVPFALLPGGDQTAFLQRLHVMGQRGLGNLQLFQQLAAAVLAAGQQPDDPEPVGIGECFADQADLVRNHGITSH